MTAIVNFRKPAPPDVAIGIGHRAPICEPLGYIQGMTISGETQVAGGWMLADITRRYPWVPSKYKSLGIVTKDHGDPTVNGGGYLFFGNVDEAPLVATSFNAARQELIDAKSAYDGVAATGFPAANPVVAHPTAADKGQFATAYWAPNGDILVGLHSQGIGDAAQSQWIARLGDSFQMVVVDPVADADDLWRLFAQTPGYPSFSHQGGYTQVFEWGGGYVCFCLRTQVEPITLSLSWSHDGLVWVTDQQRLLTRWPNLWGNTTHEFTPHGSPIMIDGKLWILGGYRLLPAGGGASTQGDLAAAPWSDDLRRPTGSIRRLVEKAAVQALTPGETITATTDGTAMAVPTLRGDAIVCHGVENSTTARRPFASRLRPAFPGEVVPPVVVADTTHQVLPNYLIPSGPDAGKLTCAAELQARPVEQYRFDGLTSIPAAIEVYNHTTAAAASLTLDPLTSGSQRGGALLIGAAANQDVQLKFGKAFTPTFVGEAHVTIEEMRLSTASGQVIQLGFQSGDRNAAYYVEWRNTTAQSNLVRLVVYDFNLLTFQVEELQANTVPRFGPWFTGQTDRVRPFHDYTFSLIATRSTQNVIRWVLRLCEGDQHVFQASVNNTFPSLVTDSVRPFLRAWGSQGSNCSVRFGGLSYALAKRNVQIGT